MVDLLVSDHLLHEVIESPISRDLQAEIDALVRGIGECGVDLKRINLSGTVLFLAACQSSDAYFTVGPGPCGPELRLVALTSPGVDPDRDRIAMVVGGSAEGPWTAQAASRSEPLELINACAEPQRLPSHTPWRVVTRWKQPEDLALRLTPIQHHLLYAHRPLLIQGVAGAGKSTILAHMAQRRLIETPTASVLLVTYTPQLQRYLTSLIAGLFEGWIPEGLHVVDWRSLCDDIATRLGLQPFNWFGEADGSFSYAWAPRTQHASETRQVGEQVRSILKGNHLDLGSPMLAEDAYLAAAGRRDQKKGILAKAMQYQAYLDAHSQVDEMDAARQLLRHGESLPRFDHVLVDETQDLTMIQLWLVARLAATPEGLAFAGDDCQMVHPSGFSWNRVRDALHRVGVAKPPRPTYLETNHRCPRPVMELALRVAAKRARRLGDPVSCIPTSDRPALPKPVRLAIGESEFEQVLAELAGTVASLGVIQTQRSWPISDQWSFQGIGFRRSFTPQAVKGIEFDVTVLLRFGRDYKHLTTSQRNRLTAEEYAFAASEVYVSITRTRGLLIALDVEGNEPQLWQDSELSKWFEDVTSPRELYEQIERGHSVDGPRGWRRAAIDFEHQRAYDAAAECWQRAGDLEKTARAFDLADRPDLAAPIYRGQGLREAAASAFARAGRIAAAAELWEELGEWARAARAWEGSGGTAVDHGRAARAWSRAESPELAAPHFEAANRWVDAASCWQDVGSTDSLRHAAVAWGRAGYARFGAGADPTEELVHAVECWSGYLGRLGVSDPPAAVIAPSPGEFAQWLLKALVVDPSAKATDYASLAKMFEDLRMWSNAGVAWTRAGGPWMAARAYVRGSDLESARAVLANVRSHAKSREAFDREAATFWAETALRFEAGKDYDLAAAAADEAGDLSRAALNLSKAGKWQKAGSKWMKAGEFKRAAEAYSRGGNDRAAAEIHEQLDEWNEAALSWMAASNDLAAANARRMERTIQMALDLERSGKPKAGVVSLSESQRFRLAAEMALRNSLWRLAAENWSAIREYVRAGGAWARQKEFRHAGEAYMLAKRWETAAKMFEEAGDFPSAVTAWKRAERTRENEVRLLAALDRARTRIRASDR